MSAQHMEVAAAREMCRLESECCAVDKDDLWKIYGDVFREDARAVLNACGASELLRALTVIAETLSALDEFANLRHIAQAAITKATGEQK